APWLIRYGLAGTRARIEQQAKALKSLTWPAFDALMPLVRDAGAEALIKRTGILIVYRSDKSWDSDARAWDIRRRHGVEWQELNADELRQFDPSLARDLTRAKFVPNNGHTVDPGGLVTALADAVIVSAGAHSKPLAASLGDNVPLETERGYHLMIRNPEVMPRVPTTDSE